MAIYFTNNTYLKLGTYDMSSVVISASLNVNFDQLEITAMGDAAHKYLPGLQSSTLSGSLYIDQKAIAAGATRAVLDSLKGTSALFEIGANGSTPATDNPVYKGSVFVNGYTPINGANGEVAQLDFTFDVTAQTVNEFPKTSV
jgi:hypothetical protein